MRCWREVGDLVSGEFMLYFRFILFMFRCDQSKDSACKVEKKSAPAVWSALSSVSNLDESAHRWVKYAPECEPVLMVVSACLRWSYPQYIMSFFLYSIYFRSFWVWLVGSRKVCPGLCDKPTVPFVKVMISLPRDVWSACISVCQVRERSTPGCVTVPNVDSACLRWVLHGSFPYIVRFYLLCLFRWFKADTWCPWLGDCAQWVLCLDAVGCADRTE